MGISPKQIHLAIVVGVALALGCAIHPVHSRLLQAGLLAGLAIVWIGLWIACSGKVKCRMFLGILPLLPIVPFLLPGKAINADSLRADYVSGLRAFDGTRYVWGGESSLGIDCSGLPRRSLRDALWTEGIRNADGNAFRRWLEHWAFDSSARAMREGHRGRTRSLGITSHLWQIDPSFIQAGDLAVRADGAHVVIYLGDHQWIEADPNRGKVHIWTSSPKDGPLYENMTFHRWVDCEPDADANQQSIKP